MMSMTTCRCLKGTCHLVKTENCHFEPASLLKTYFRYQIKNIFTNWIVSTMLINRLHHALPKNKKKKIGLITFMFLKFLNISGTLLIGIKLLVWVFNNSKDNKIVMKSN